MGGRSWAVHWLAMGMLGAAAAAAGAADPACLDCHGDAARPPGAGDFVAYFAELSRHHPVGVVQPRAGDATYRQPDGLWEGMPFFDRNGNGTLEVEELRLSGAGMVECASCHRAHGGGEPAPEPPDSFLRMSNANSALCGVCHRM